MSKIEQAVKYAIEIAQDNSHGYDQTHRDGPDYDCSSLVNYVVKKAGIPIKATYTGNMLDDYLFNGFFIASDVDKETGKGLQIGDILLTHYNGGNGHTAIYIGDGKLVHASGNEFGGITGGRTGDQTGNEICIAKYFNFPWMYVLRYAEEDVITSETDYYTVQRGDTLSKIAVKFGTTVGILCDLNDIPDANLIYAGQVLMIRKSAGQSLFSKNDIEIAKKVLKYLIESGALDALAR